VRRTAAALARGRLPRSDRPRSDLDRSGECRRCRVRGLILLALPRHRVDVGTAGWSGRGPSVRLSLD
jgi:hypothetical protein